MLQPSTFNASRDFTVCAAVLLASGKTYEKGDRFQKSSVTVRTLEQLHQQRKIAYAGTPLTVLVKSDPIVTGSSSRGAPSIGELERAVALAEGLSKPDLLALADGVEGVRKEMNKKAIALAVVRAGRGNP